MQTPRVVTALRIRYPITSNHVVFVICDNGEAHCVGDCRESQCPHYTTRALSDDAIPCSPRMAARPLRRRAFYRPLCAGV